MPLTFYLRLPLNQAELARSFPSQFPDGFARCIWPDGWHGLVRNVCTEAQKFEPGLRWTQIKEKFGSLRMYYQSGPTGGVEPVRPGAHGAIFDVVEQAEVASMSCCMSCGDRGDRANYRWWVVILCPACKKVLADHVAL